MSVQPIDLQVLFARLNLIGREQTAQRNSILQAQSVAASEIAQRSEEEGRRVSELSTEEDGPEKVKDDDETAADSNTGEHSQDSEPDSDSPRQEILRDPDLGQNVDISG